MVSIYLYILINALLAHDFHLSKTEVRYKEDKLTIQISTHIFIDDLEEVLATYGHTDLQLFSNNEDLLADQYLLEYIQSTLFVEVDGQVLEFNWVGKEISEDLAAVWCYLEVPDISMKGEISVLNKLLHDLFEDQKNVLTFQYNSERKQHMFFSKGDEPKSFEL